jgi:hypothetical protein
MMLFFENLVLAAAFSHVCLLIIAILGRIAMIPVSYGREVFTRAMVISYETMNFAGYVGRAQELSGEPTRLRRRL